MTNHKSAASILLVVVTLLACTLSSAPTAVPTATNAPPPASASPTSVPPVASPTAITPTATPPLHASPTGAPAGASPAASATAAPGTGASLVTGVFGAPVTFATHAELSGFGFLWGPSDGQFGAIPAGGDNYTFYGVAAAASTCAGSPNAKGEFSFTGTLDHVTGSNGCRQLFGPGDGPTGWTFDRDYAGGGEVVRFASGGHSGLFVAFHAEYHWKNKANPPSDWCKIGTTGSQVPCFYSSIGLAVSTDNGKTFHVVGQIAQPSQPLSTFDGGGNNMEVGYGSLLVADANGQHLDNPPADPSRAYYYLFYSNALPSLPGACAHANCLAVARAPYTAVVAAAFSGDPHQVAALFHNYDGASPDAWTQLATAWDSGSQTPDLAGTAGKFAPLWSDGAAYEPSVIYDGSFNVYLAVYAYKGGFQVRTSSDLLHWSKPVNAGYFEAGRALVYQTLMGETGDPTIGGPAPRVYFSSFPTGAFPDYKTQIFESVTLTVSRSQ